LGLSPRPVVVVVVVIAVVVVVKPEAAEIFTPLLEAAQCVPLRCSSG